MYGEMIDAEKVFALKERGTSSAWLQAVIGEPENHKRKPAANEKERKERGDAWQISFFAFHVYSFTGTGAAMVRLSGVTAHSMARTSTPAAAARRRASPKAG